MDSENEKLRALLKRLCVPAANEAEPASAQDERDAVYRDAELYGIGFMVDGVRVHPSRVTVQYSATRPAQTEQQPVYVECRECTDCGHVGINDAHPTDATCAMCDWSGLSPVEDQCPDCGKENAMGAACPKCSGRYRILAETHVAAPIALEEDGLRAHGLDIGSPSQLSDVFRHGIKWALEQTAPQPEQSGLASAVRAYLDARDKGADEYDVKRARSDMRHALAAQGGE